MPGRDRSWHWPRSPGYQITASCRQKQASLLIGSALGRADPLIAKQTATTNATQSTPHEARHCEKAPKLPPLPLPLPLQLCGLVFMNLEISMASVAECCFYEQGMGYTVLSAGSTSEWKANQATHGERSRKGRPRCPAECMLPN